MNFNFSKKMFINRNIDGFKITINKTIRDAIKNIKENKGLPLIIINNSHEFLGTLSNGDIATYLSNSKNKIDDPIKDAFNKNAKYCFEEYDKSIKRRFILLLEKKL